MWEASGAEGGAVVVGRAGVVGRGGVVGGAGVVGKAVTGGGDGAPQPASRLTASQPANASGIRQERIAPLPPDSFA